VGVEPRSRDRDHTVAVKRCFNPLGHAADIGVVTDRNKPKLGLFSFICT